MRRDWRADALCTQVTIDDAVWFPLPNASTKIAKETCARCPVRNECLTFALEHRQTGIWGGTTERERDRMRRRRVAA